MTATRTAILLLLTVTLFASTASGQVFFEGQEDQPINRTYTADGIQLSTEHVNKTIPYKNATYPDTWHDGLKKWQKAVTDKSDSFQIQIETEWAKSSPAPEPLQGRKINADYSVKKGETKGTLHNGTYYDDKGNLAVDVTAKSILEHVIVTYKIYNQSAKTVNGTLEPETIVKDTYSGQEPPKFPIRDAWTKTFADGNTYKQEVTQVADNRHEPKTNITVVTANPTNYSFSSIETTNTRQITSISDASSWYNVAENQVEEKNLNESILIPDGEKTNYEYNAFNITLNEDTTSNIRAIFNTGKKSNVGGLKAYIIGSIAGTTTYESNSLSSLDEQKDKWTIEGFEPNGNFDDAWTFDNNNIFTTNNEARNGSYSGNWQVDGSQNQEARYDLTSISNYTKPAYYSYWLKQTGGGSFQSGRTEILSDGTTMVRVEVFRDSTYSRGDVCGDNYDELNQYNDNWHLIQVKDIDYGSQTFDVYIDGNLVVNDHAFCNDVSNPTELFVQSGSATTTDHYYDTFRSAFKNVAPTIQDVGSTPSKWQKDEPVDISLNATDKNGDDLTATYKVLKDGSPYVSETQMNQGQESDFSYSNAFTPNDLSTYKLIMNVTDTQSGYNSSITTQDVIASPPSVTLNKPSNTSSKGSPVTFGYTPKCFSQSCSSASLYINTTGNVSSNLSTDTTSEWNEGTLNDLVVSDGVLSIVNNKFTDGFEHNSASDGSNIPGNNGWVNDNFAMEYDTSNVKEGSYSAFGDVGSTNSPLMHKQVYNADKEVSSVSAWYRETSSSTGHGVSFRDSNGDRVFGFWTDNPQFGIFDQTGYNGGQNEGDLCSSSYNTWYEVNITLNWDQGTFSFDRSDGCSGSGYDLGSYNGISQVYIENANQNSFDATNGIYSWVDTITFAGKSLSSGNYTSKDFNAGNNVWWNKSSIDSTLPTDTAVKADYATNKSGSWKYYDTIGGIGKSQYARFNLTLSTNTSTSPSVNEVNLTYLNETTVFNAVNSTQSVQNDTENELAFNFSTIDTYTAPQTYNWNVEVEQSDGQTALADQNYTVTVTAFSVSDPSIANFSIDPSPFVVGDSFTSSADVVANSSNLKFVNITIEEPDGTVAVSDVEMVNVSNPASLYEYVYDTADQVTGIGEWNVTIDAENTEGGVSSQSETVDGIWSESLLNGLSSTETGGSQSTVGRERQEGVSDTGIAGRVLDIARQSMERVDLDIAAVKDRSMARSVASSITSRTSSAVQHIVNVASLTGISGDSRADRSVDVVRSLQETALVDTDAVKDRSMARAFTSAVVADSSVDFERSLDRNGTASIDTAGLTERQVEFARTFNEVTDVHIDTAREIRLARKALNAVASRDRLLFERRMERFLTAAQVVEDRDEVSLVYGRTGSEQSLVSDIGQRVTELARSVTRNVESVSMVSPRQSIERTMMEDIVVSTDTNRELDVARTILNQLDTSQTSDETAVWMTNPVTGAIMDWGDRRTNTYTFPDDITGYNGTKQDTTYTLTSLTGNSGTQSLVSKTYDVKKNTTATITVGGASGGTGDTYADAGIEYTSPPGNGGYIEATMDVSNASNISIVLGNKGEDGFSSSGGAGATADGGNGVQATYDTGLASYVSEGGPGGGDSVIKVDGEIVAYIGAGGGGAAETSYTNAGGSGGARGGSGVTPEDTSYESVATGNDAQGTGLGGNGSKDARIGSGGGGGVEVVGNDRFIDYSTQTGGSSGTATASVNMSSKRPKKIKYDNEQSFTNGLVEDISERDGVNATTASNNYTYQKYNVSIDSRQSKRDSVTVEWRGATANTTRAHLYVRDWNTGEWRHIETVDSSSLTTVNETFNGSLADDIVANQQITLMAIDP